MNNKEQEDSQQQSDNQTNELKEYQDASKILGVTNSLTTTEDIIHPKILQYFRKLFRSERNIIQVAIEKRFSSCSIFLTVVQKHQNVVKCEYNTSQVGPPHNPIFTTEVVLQSRKYDNVMIKLDAAGLKKIDAKNAAFFKLASLIHQST